MKQDRGHQWQMFNDRIFASDGKLVCQLNTANPEWRAVGRLVAAVPLLVGALEASVTALEEASPQIPAHSEADVLAAKAITLAFAAFREAGIGSLESDPA
jgi:hypothetical protein